MPSKPAWTPEEDALLEKLWEEGVSAREIAKRIGRTKNATQGRASRIGCPPRPSPLGRENVAQMERLRATILDFYESLARDGKTLVSSRDIADALGVSKYAVEAAGGQLQREGLIRFESASHPRRRRVRIPRLGKVTGWMTIGGSRQPKEESLLARGDRHAPCVPMREPAERETPPRSRVWDYVHRYRRQNLSDDAIRRILKLTPRQAEACGLRLSPLPPSAFGDQRGARA